MIGLPPLLLWACSEAPLDANFDGGPAFRIAGEVSPGVAVSGTDTRAAVAWAWVVDQNGGLLVEDAAFEARIWAYGMEIPPPPTPEGTLAPWPTLGALPDGAGLLGMPFLYEPDGSGEAPTFEVDPDGFVPWLDGVGESPVVARGGARVAALPEAHLVGLYAGQSSTLGEHPYFSGDCALSELVPGLTLYRRDASGCGGLTPVALPGERLEFQGVTVRAP